MTQEEAIKVIKDNWPNGRVQLQEALETLIPELKESEDEGIRKELIDFVKSRLAGFPQCEKFIAWLEKQGEQKHICKLDNSYAHVRFPFKAKVKSTDKIVTINGGQLSLDGKEWIKYQSDFEDGYKIYEPNDLELVCEIEQKHAWSEEDEDMLKSVIATCELSEQDRDSSLARHILEMQTNWLKSLKERVKGE